MSGDLISKKEVIKIIDELGYVDCHDDRDFEANSRVDKIRQKIIEHLIVFDLEGIIEKIEEKIECTEIQIELANDFEDKNFNDIVFFSERKRCYDEILKIIKFSTNGK